MSSRNQVALGIVVGVVAALLWRAPQQMVGTAGAQVQGYGQVERAVVAAPEKVPGQEHAAWEWPAGTEYRLSDPSLDRWKASLAPLWTFEGNIGTYGDGQTQVELGDGGKVRIVLNATAISDACLEAQLKYGISVDGAGVASACTGVWTKEWAQAQGGDGQ